MNRTIALILSASLCAGAVLAAQAQTASAKKSKKKSTTGKKKKGTSAKKAAPKSTWKSPTYADSTEGDNVDGEDLVVRRAAVAALGAFNGAVVVADAGTGRVLSIINQKLALAGGFIPCSTIKLVTTFAALSEGIMEPEQQFHISRRLSYDLTEALAHSNNQYFANLGQKLGFQRVVYYAKLFGLGEKAGLEIPGEQPGIVPAAPPENGGVGMMTSFGEGFKLTPLELAGILTAIANNGTMYYLQYPRTQDDLTSFVPRIKRRLEITPWIPSVKVGMRAVTNYGTGRRASYATSEPIMGKTGTCTDYQFGYHMGWFGSFNEVGDRKLVVVVMLTGGHSVSGPVAAGVAGNVYKNLSDQKFFAHALTEPNLPLSLITTQACCRR